MSLARFKTGSSKKKAKRKPVSKYSGVTPAEDRDPILGDGDEKGVSAGPRTLHRVRVLQTEEFDGEKNGGTFFRARLEIIQSSCYEEGEVRAFLQCVTKGNAMRVGGPKVMSFVQHAAGFSDFDSFVEDKGGEAEAAQFVDACSGDEDAVEVYGENPVEGNILDVIVTPNGPPKTYTDERSGEEKSVQYYNYAWSVFTEEEEDEEEEPAPKKKKKLARR